MLDVRMRLGFLFAGYSTDRSGVVVAWEAVVMVRKLTVALAASAVSDPYLQILVALLILVLSGFATAYVQPYEITMLNLLDIGGLLVLIVTQILSIVYFYAESVERPFMDSTTLEVLITTVLFLLNVAAVLSFLAAYIVEVASVRARCSRRGMRVVKVVTDEDAVMNVLRPPEGRGDAPGDANQEEEAAGMWWHHPSGVGVQEAPQPISIRGDTPEKWGWSDATGQIHALIGLPELLEEADDIASLNVGDSYRWMHTDSHELSDVAEKLEDVGGRTCRRRRPAPADDDRGAIENEDALGGIAVAVRLGVANETLNPFAQDVASNDRNTDDGIELTEL